MSFRYAICNETFVGWPHERVCRLVAEYGYQGLEVAPFTLAPRVTDFSAERRREFRRAAEADGLQIIGLHWLLAKTNGLHLTSDNASVRRDTAAYLGELARCCRDLGGEVLVFGSPRQRCIPDGATREQAFDWALATFAQALPALDETGVALAIEPLASEETDFINTCEDAHRLVDALGSPRVGLHLDVKAMCVEQSPPTELIRRHGRRALHFHANDANRRGPGFGDVDFRPVLAGLSEAGYAGWISVEVFDYTPDPETIARDSLRYLRQCEISSA